MRQDPDNCAAQDRTKPSRRVHRVLDKPVDSAPMPVVSELGGGVRLIDLDAEDKGYVRGASVRGAVEKRTKCRTGFDGASWVNVHIGVIAAVVPEKEISEKVSPEDIVRI